MRHSGLGLIDPYALLARAGVVSGWVIADLGCGSLGHFVFPAAELAGSSGRVYALDVQCSAVRLLERQARAEQCWHVHPVWSDVEDPRYAHIPAQAVDLTMIVNALYLARERERWAEAAWRITKPGGRLLVVDWHPEAAPLGPEASLRLSPETVRALFEARGWVTDEALTAGDHHHGHIFRRPDEPGMGSVEFTSQPLA